MIRTILIAGLATAGLVAGVAQAAGPKTYVAKQGAVTSTVQIVDAGGGLFRVSLVRSGPDGCSAKLDGEAKLSKGVLRLVKTQGADVCEIDVTPKGAFIEVLENKCATVYRADICRFDDLPIMSAK